MSTAVVDPNVTAPVTPPATPAAGTPAPPPAGQPAAPAAPVTPAAPATVEPSDDEITITSTTDSEQEVQAALEGKVPVTPPAADKTTAPAPGTEQPPQDGQPADADAAAASDAAKTLATRKRTAQQRIDELTWQANETRRMAEAHAAENARLRNELAAARGQGGQPGASGATPPAAPGTPPAAPAAKPKPDLKDYQDQPDPYKAWAEDLTTWSTEQALATVRAETEAKLAQQQQQTAQQRQQETEMAQRQTEWNAHTARTAAFRASIPNYDDTLQAAMDVFRSAPDAATFDIPAAMQVYIVQSETGPGLFYNLVQDPAELRRIVALPSHLMLPALGRYEERLDRAGKLTPTKATAPATTGTPSADPATRAIDALTSSSTAAAPVTTAPAPPTLVGGSPTATTVPAENMSYDDFRKMRNEQERKRFRR